MVVGVGLAALGTTDVLRELWISMVTPPSAIVPSPIAVFTAYLVQTTILTWMTFRAYRFDHPGVTAAAWILATWEAIAMITRGNLMAMKQMHPTLYNITAFAHIVSVSSLFLAMGIRSQQQQEADRREARLARQEYRRRRL